MGNKLKNFLNQKFVTEKLRSNSKIALSIKGLKDFLVSFGPDISTDNKVLFFCRLFVLAGSAYLSHVVLTPYIFRHYIYTGTGKYILLVVIFLLIISLGIFYFFYNNDKGKKN